MSATYGDDEPEDEYDATDPLPVRLIVIAKIATALAGDTDEERRIRRRLLIARLLRRITAELDPD